MISLWTATSSGTRICDECGDKLNKRTYGFSNRETQDEFVFCQTCAHNLIPGWHTRALPQQTDIRSNGHVRSGAVRSG